jgi:hypothetical protein
MLIVENAPFAHQNALIATMQLTAIAAKTDLCSREQFAKKPAKMDTSAINQSAQLALQDALNVLPLTLAPNALIITY